LWTEDFVDMNLNPAVGRMDNRRSASICNLW
jgi:hypothetical protein